MSPDILFFVSVLFGSLLHCTNCSSDKSTDHAPDRWPRFRRTTVVVCLPDSVQLQCPVHMHLLVVSVASPGGRGHGESLPTEPPAASPSCRDSNGNGQPLAAFSTAARPCPANSEENVEKRFRQLCEDRQLCQIAAHQLLENSTRCPTSVGSPATIAYKCVPDGESGLTETICADTYVDVKCDSQHPSGTSMAIISAHMGVRSRYSERHDFDECPISSVPEHHDERSPLVCDTRVDVTNHLQEMCNGQSSCSASPSLKMTQSSGTSLESCGKMHLSLTYVCVASNLLVPDEGTADGSASRSLPTDIDSNASRRRKSQRQPKEIQNMKAERPRSENTLPTNPYINNDQPPSATIESRRGYPEVGQQKEPDSSSSKAVSTSALFQPMAIGLVVGLAIILVCITTLVLTCRGLYRRAHSQRKFSPGHANRSSLFGPTVKEPPHVAGNHSHQHTSADHFNESSLGACSETLLPRLVGSDMYPCLGHQSHAGNLVENYLANRAMMCSTGMSEGGQPPSLVHQLFDARKLGMEGAGGQSLLAGRNQFRSSVGSTSPAHSNQPSVCLSANKSLEFNSVPLHSSQPADQLYNRTDCCGTFTPTPILYDANLYKTSSMTETSASGRGCDGNSGHSESSDGPRAPNCPGEAMGREGVVMKMLIANYRYPGDRIYDPVLGDPCNSAIYSPGSNASQTSGANLMGKLHFSDYLMDASQLRNITGDPVGLDTSGPDMSHRGSQCGQSKLQMTTSVLSQRPEITLHTMSTLNPATDVCSPMHRSRRLADDTPGACWNQLSPVPLPGDHQASTESLAMPVIEPPKNFRSPPVSGVDIPSSDAYYTQGYPPLLSATLQTQAQNMSDADESECQVEEPPPRMPPLRGLVFGNRFADNSAIYFSPHPPS